MLYPVEALGILRRDPRLAPSVLHLNIAASENQGSRSGSRAIHCERLRQSLLPRTFVSLRPLLEPRMLDSCQMVNSHRDGIPGGVSLVQVRFETAESVFGRRRIS